MKKSNLRWISVIMSLSAVSSVMAPTLSLAAAQPKKSEPALLSEPEGEDWKGRSTYQEVQVGGLMGLGVVDSRGGFALIGNISKKIVKRGFVPDVNDSVWIELQLGPLITSGTTSIQYSANLRWDFQKDTQWTLYAIGGLGGTITGEALGNRFLLFPRFGIGAFCYLREDLAIRAELSHELIAAGVSVGF